MTLDESRPVIRNERPPAGSGHFLFPMVGVLAGLAAFAAVYLSWPLVTKLPGYPAPAVAAGSESASASGGAVPSPVRNLTAKGGERRLTLSWDAPEGGLRGRYVVDVLPERGGSQLRRCTTQRPSCVIKGLINGDTYTVEVRHEDGQGARSAPQTARTTPHPEVLDSRASRLWFDADDPGTVSDGGAKTAKAPVPAATWRDKSGNKNDATQSDQVLRPTWVRSRDRFLMEFSGNQRLVLDGRRLPKGAEPSTIFAVLDQRDPDPASCFRHVIAWGSNRPGAARIVHKGCGTELLFVETFGTHEQMQPGRTWPRGTLAVLTARITRSGIEVRLNGSPYYSWETPPETPTDTFLQDTALLGGAPWAPDSGWLGRMGEIAVIAGELNNTEVRRVEGYLTRKWGIA